MRRGSSQALRLVQVSRLWTIGISTMSEIPFSAASSSASENMATIGKPLRGFEPKAHTHGISKRRTNNTQRESLALYMVHAFNTATSLARQSKDAYT